MFGDGTYPDLANVSFGKLEALWKHRSYVAKAIRLQSYRALVESVLLYNCGTWALSSALADLLDRAQRKMLRKVMGLTWKHKVTNEDLYAMCTRGCLPASVQVINARWRLFGHVLRMNEENRKFLAFGFGFRFQNRKFSGVRF